MLPLSNMESKKFVSKNDQGQALLFVVIAMTIALAVGINTSVRSITSLSRTARTDTSSRALAAAEGGIEHYLSLSTTELESSLSGSCVVGEREDATNSCLIKFDTTSDSTEVLVSEARVTVARYEPPSYPFSLESGQIKEVNLYDYINNTFYSRNDIRICWTSVLDPTTGRLGSDLMYLSYNVGGVRSRGGLYGNNRPAAATGYASGGFTAAGAGGGSGYNNCATVNIGSNIYGLRIRSMGGISNIAVFPTGGARLPLQGYTITSVGRIAQDVNVTATRSITVIRSLPYLPVSFDYALYTQGTVTK